MNDQATTHLWEVDHPYYCQEGNYFKTGQHEHYASWQEFLDETGFVDGDRDMNLLIRWDWRKPGFHEWDGTEYLLLFFVLQRKAWLLSKQIAVTEADEPAIRAFLTECAETLRATWEPILDTAPAAAEAGEQTASLLVDRTSSTCGACGQPTLPSALTHANVSGYDPKPGGGCGARFTTIRSVNRAVTEEDLRSLRPDLPLAP